MSEPVATLARKAFREIHGVVVSAGLMQKTVKVRVGTQKWNQKVQKMFAKPQNYLVHDPNSSLRTGDVVSISPGWRTSSNKRHIVNSIIAPYGTPIEERPPIPTWEELIAVRAAKKQVKQNRRAGKTPEDGPDDFVAALKHKATPENESTCESGVAPENEATPEFETAPEPKTIAKPETD